MCCMGRNIIVNYATNPYKGGGGQSSVPPTAALPVPAPYAASHYNNVPPGPSTSTYQTHGYGQGPYPRHYNQNQ
ncbi:hypothetical protein L195_g060332 [Trifolium pratense]|uniref:Uncharacterized protein n=1 Tax=Trifolium pratense TaxID=57577 RepID=A0A2K3K380_TRIPR|nr:hypothetical protein L195_g060332 [Trifolium pratense]